MKDSEELRKILTPEPKRVRVENPATLKVQLYERAEVNGEIVKMPYTSQITDIDGIPYKVIGWAGKTAFCQQCTVQEVADLAEQWAKGLLGQPGEV